MNDLKESNHYWLIIKNEEPVLAYFYRNPDALMNPEKPIKEGKDYSLLGFGFNIADGGGFVPIEDLNKSTEVIDAKIDSKWLSLKNEMA